MGFIKDVIGLLWEENSRLSLLTLILLSVLVAFIFIIIVKEIKAAIQKVKKKKEFIQNLFHRVKGVFVVIFFSLLLVSAVWSLYYLPKILVEKGEETAITKALETKKGKENVSLKSLTSKEYLDAEDNARKTIAQIFGAVLVFIGFFLAWQRNQIQQEGQLTERFTKAIEQLGKSNEQGTPTIEIRLGGIYALEKLAKDSREYHDQIFETLTAYVRENAPWPPAVPASGATTFSTTTASASGAATLTATETPLRKDIQAVLTVIGRRRWTRFEEGRLDLSSTDLRRANLYKANLVRVNFERTNLTCASLEQSNLTDAWLYWAILERAHLEKANLIGAKLYNANLTGAWLEKANLMVAKLYNADLGGAHLLEANLTGADLCGADLRYARLNKANLTGAELYGADLTDANLKEANLTSAEFSGKPNLAHSRLMKVKLDMVLMNRLLSTKFDTIGLTLEQIKSAQNYDKAILPTYLQAQQTQDQQNTPPQA